MDAEMMKGVAALKKMRANELGQTDCPRSSPIDRSIFNGLMAKSGIGLGPSERAGQPRRLEVWHK